jgi:hypothetical protein
MRNTTSDDTRRRIVNILKTAVPALIRKPFQVLYRAFPKFLCEKCSLFMSFNMMAWLVGPSERFDLDILVPTKGGTDAGGTGATGGIGSTGVGAGSTTEQWRSGVKLTECRYLMESGCKANCLHLCKGPTQEFFMNDLKLPLYMKPNFTDYSCELQFGVTPPPMEEDPAYKEKCFTDCPAAKFPTELKC